MSSNAVATRIRSSEERILAEIAGISENLATSVRHIVRSMRGRFLAAAEAYEASDYTGCTSILDEIRESRLVRGAASLITLTKTAIDDLMRFLRTKLGPFLELVFGASLVSLLPVAGGAAIGAAVGVGAGLGTLLGAALVLLGIVIMFHSLLLMERADRIAAIRAGD